MTAMTGPELLGQLPLPEPRPAGTSTALQGLKVLDFTHFVAGPFATLILADCGADVIKIESPQRGDEFRHYPPADPRLDGQGPPFLWVNRNKRSLALDLKTKEGRRIVHELVAQADVLVENYSTGTMERLGVGYAECAALNPRLVYCSVSAFGRTGEYKDRNGFDTIMQAETGFIAMNGYPDREGVRTGSSSIDIATGMMACNAIQAALLERHRSGKGQWVQAPLFDTSFIMVGFAVSQYLFSNVTPGRHGNTSPDTSPTGVFYASDGGIYINCGNTGIFQRLFRDVLGKPDMAEDVELVTREGRLRRREELFATVNEVLSSHPRDHWMPLLMAADVPAGAVRSVPDALVSPEMRSRGLLTRVPHPRAGFVPNVALPLNFSRTPVADPVAAPTIGQHNRDILEELRAGGWLGGAQAA